MNFLPGPAFAPALVQQSLVAGYHLLRFAVAIIFFWSGLSKALDPGLFAETIEAFGLMPPIMTLPAALVLIGAELIAGLGLIFEKRGALTGSTLLMLLFMGVLGYGMHLGLDIDCGCFGPGDVEAVAFHGLRDALLRDVLILIAIGYLYLWRFLNGLTTRPWLVRVSRQSPTKEV